MVAAHLAGRSALALETLLSDAGAATVSRYAIYSEPTLVLHWCSTTLISSSS